MQKLRKSSISPDELSSIDFLATEMERYWAKGRPPKAELANLAFNRTFLSIQPSPLFEECLRGRRLTDLGAGNPHAMMVLADHFLASEYVGVDSHRDYSRYEGLLANTRFVTMDMLRYLGGEPDRSSNFVLNNIDRAVLALGDRVLDESYQRMVAYQMARIVPSGGIVFGLGSPILHVLAEFGLERVEHTGAFHVGDCGAVYKKK